ncbi:hypothetical protein [Nonomuraea gerenzanensis]|uniref:Putative integral membrane protein n=1 Tax=Nonomuraea gerenzanensis TaxID=93944 RepID=A0A1M4ENU6_9ACTN|nr:hypothetical protein [Nonomuraea gerenzanensis]UBU11981.1 hypothetical protein LCN96_48090 [Nonomuraea gerenzanensis]SBP00497.1 putative integral membrane protein [Nonomuraea gerenzanensis]
MIETGPLRAEWTKFASIRATMVLSLVTVAVSGAFGWLFGNAAATEYAELTARERLDFQPLDMGMRGVFIAQLLLAALGVLIVSSEYGSGTMRASLSAVGRRGRLLAAKAGLTVLTALPVSVAALWLMYTISQVTLAANGVPYLMPGDPAALRMLLLGPVVLTLLAVFGLALGFLLRSTASAVNAGTAFLLVPVLATPSPAPVRDFIQSFWPNTTAFRALSGTSELPPLVAFGLFVAFVAVLMIAAFVHFKQRDA